MRVQEYKRIRDEDKKTRMRIEDKRTTNEDKKTRKRDEYKRQQ